MDEMTFDWLQQINHEAWRRRIYQLRRELSQERIELQQLQSRPQEVVVSPQPEQTRLDKPRLLRSSARYF